MNLFADEQTNSLVDVFAELYNTGVRQAFAARVLLALLLLFWIGFHAPDYSDFFYHIAILLLFVSVGLGYLLLHSNEQSKSWHPYLLVVIDVCLLSVELRHHPYETNSIIQPAQIFLYYFALMALHSLHFMPRLIAWSAAVSTLFWMFGLVLLLDSSNPVTHHAIQVSNWLPQISVLLAVGVMLSLGMHQFTHFAFKQLSTEREFHNILLTERSGNSNENYDCNVFTDPLTGLGTRAAFERDSAQFARVFNEGRLIDLSIALIDLEGANKVLQERGEAAYEDLLREFAKVSKTHFRSSDMPYHLGDHQFALLAPGATPGNADRLRKLLDAIVAEVRTQGFPEISAKMGLSTLHEATHKPML